MDSFTERMLERAKARQKKLEEHYSNTNENLKMPLQEPNVILKKYENSSGMAKSQPNLTECTKIKRKEVVSDTCLNTKSLYYDSSLKENLSESNIAKKSCTRVSSEMPSSPQTPTKTLNIQKENFNMEIKLTSTDNVRVEVEIEERDDSDIDNEDDIISNDKPEIQMDKPDDIDDKPVIRTDVKNRLQRLGKLYSGVDEVQLSSPISRNESKFCADSPKKDKEVNKPAGSGLGRLKALSNTINQWEDEVTTFTSKSVSSKDAPKKSWKPPAPKPPTTTTSSFTHSPNKGPAPQPPKNLESTKVKVNTKVSSREASPEKRVPSSPQKSNTSAQDSKTVPWDNSVIASLESQGFTRTNSNSKLVYNYKSDGKPNEDKEELEDLEEELEDDDDEEEEESKIALIAAKFIEIENEEKKPSAVPKSPTKTNLRCGDVMNKAAIFEKNQSPTKSKDKDPALMSVSERMALFEKNKGAALVPKAAFGMAAPVKNTDKEVALSSKTTGNKSQKPSSSSTSKASVSPRKSTDKKSIMSPTKAFIAESGGIASKMRALLEKKTTISQSQIANKIQEQRQKDLDILLNRFNKNKDEEQDNEEDNNIEELSSDEESISETTKMLPDRTVKIVQFKEKDNLPPPPPPPPVVSQKTVAPKRRSKGDSPKVREVLEEVKRIRVSPPKSGRMYPCLSDIEASTETETTTAEPSPETSYEDNCSYESEEPNTSFGREILEVVTKNQTPQKRPILDDSTASDLSDILDGMDDYLDEAMAYGDSDYTEGPTPPKLGKSTSTPPRTIAAPSHSFHYSNGSPSKYNTPVASSHQRSPAKQMHDKPVDLPTHVMDGDNVLPLAHTVSFYRKQQAQGSRTPVRQITRQPVVEEESPEKDDPVEAHEVAEKVQELMNTVTKQQTVISQASQALNLCCSTIEFSGSCEQVEAERLLLVATQRRQAALHEVQRLRVEGTLHPGGGIAVDKGTLTISNITLPLKKEYVRALSAAGGQGHHIVCLVRYAEHVIPTRLVSTVASPKDEPELNLKVPGSVKLEQIYSDFTVTVEVYSLQAQEELLPHEVKYHINTKKSGSKLTPKKLKNDSKLVMPSIQSPAGPQAVRSSSFALMGYIVFSLQAINRKHWTLNNTPAMSPLEGSVQMKVHCELAVSVEHKGFLTMFDDISGFGAWHRRWCLLKGNNISYWKYPDDERKKAPIDSISLQSCTTKNVSQVSREICARPYTFLLETVRPAKSSDKDSLVTICQGNKTIIRHLLSADTKEERIEWCEKFNKALEAMRLWGTNKN